MKSHQLKINTAILILFFSACKTKVENKEHEHTEDNNVTVTLSEEQSKTAEIQTDILKELEMSHHIKVSGKIDVPPQNMVSVSAPLGGILKNTKLLPGLHLSKGEIIANMQDQAFVQLQEEYLTIKAELESSEKDFKRQEKLLETQSSSNKAYDDSKSLYTKQMVQLNALAEKLKLIGVKPENLTPQTITSVVNIYSPIDGYVSKVNVNIGKYINASEVMFELVNPADIHLNLTVFEKDIQYLSIGQKVKAYSSAKPDLVYPCDIILIGQDVSSDRHVEVHCHFEKYDRSLIPGMYMNGEIQTNLKKVLAISESAVLSYDGKNYIFVETGKNKFEMKEVTTGVSDNGKIEILNASGLENKKIVVNGAYSLLMVLTNKETEGHSH